MSLRLNPEEAVFLANATDNVRFCYETVGLLSLEVMLYKFCCCCLSTKYTRQTSNVRMDIKNIVVSTQDTWRKCLSHSSSFVHEYIAYHHFRSKVGVP